METVGDEVAIYRKTEPDHQLSPIQLLSQSPPHCTHLASSNIWLMIIPTVARGPRKWGDCKGQEERRIKSLVYTRREENLAESANSRCFSSRTQRNERYVEANK